MRGVPHHVLDVASPKKVFSAQDFIDHASIAIQDILSRGKLPIVAGGTGFYIDALTQRITLANVAPNPLLRKRLEKKSATALYKLLQKKDPARALLMATPSERNNKVRLIRALEIAAQTVQRGATPPTKTDTYTTLWIGIAPDMKVLEKKIDIRLQERLKHGMIPEARKLHAARLSYKRMDELGLEYRFLAQFLQKKISREALESELAIAIRQYAKRQIVYWKRNRDIVWFTSPQDKQIETVVQKWIGTEQ
jgi:tRNA dimethylallyltransferase